MQRKSSDSIDASEARDGISQTLRAAEVARVEIQRTDENSDTEYATIPVFYADVSNLFSRLDNIAEQIEESEFLNELVAGSSLVAATGLTAGYILWMVRGGYLIAMLSSTLPTWATVDPLPVLSAAGWSAKRNQNKDDKSLADLVS